jgi:hypothetical protein
MFDDYDAEQERMDQDWEVQEYEEEQYEVRGCVNDDWYENQYELETEYN